jgi:hypothetical protein
MRRLRHLPDVGRGIGGGPDRLPELRYAVDSGNAGGASTPNAVSQLGEEAQRKAEAEVAEEAQAAERKEKQEIINAWVSCGGCLLLLLLASLAGGCSVATLIQ